ncbi:MAG: phosphatase PAP2 family protein [Dehalococcoidia bacterium]
MTNGEFAAVASFPRSRIPYLLMRARPFSVPAICWSVYCLLLFPYVWIRSVGDEWLPWHNGAHLESAIFGGSATELLQEHIYSHDLVWFDFGGFLLHLTWFAAPLAVFVLINVYERHRFPEFLLWSTTMAYMSTIGILLLPLTPPWMASHQVTRILEQRQFIPYTGLDNNPVAAFPSLHAGLPMMMALFLLIRCPRLRVAAVLAFAYSLAMGFAVVYLGEHWVVDVIAGYALAGAVAVIFAGGKFSPIKWVLPPALVTQVATMGQRIYQSSCPSHIVRAEVHIADLESARDPLAA